MARKATTKTAAVSKPADTVKTALADASATDAKAIDTKKAETKTAAENKTEPKAAAAKKTERKTTAKKAERKSAAKTAAKTDQTPAAKKEMQVTAYVEYQGRKVEEKDMVAQVKKAWTKSGGKIGDIRTMDLYIKPEENAVYYVINGTETGAVAF